MLAWLYGGLLAHYAFSFYQATIASGIDHFPGSA
jgi:hypothetical protein